MKIAVFGDGHLTNSLSYTHSGDKYRKKMLCLYIYEFFVTIIEEAVDFLVIPGDLLHSTYLGPDDVDLLNYFVFHSLMNSGTHTVISLGNHDVDGDDSILKFLNRFIDDKIHYCDKSVSWSYSSEESKINFDVINYCDHHTFLEKAREFPVTKKGICNILVGHIGVKGTLHGTTKSIVGVKKEDIEEIESNYDLVILGHHHNMQWVTKKCFYPGSVHQTRIDEIDTVPGGVIIEFKNGKLDTSTKIENKLSPRFVIVKDYKFNPEEIKNSIVKPILDLDSKTEEENLSFLKSILKCDPYFLIKPRTKKQFMIEEDFRSYSPVNKLEAIVETMKSFKLKKEESAEFKENTIKIWNNVIGGK
jgi:DNA repair exonuclease SbcCD nuclease subunit